MDSSPPGASGTLKMLNVDLYQDSKFLLVDIMEKGKESSHAACQHCGAEIKMDMDEECPGCHRDVKDCVIDKDVTSSIYPM